MTETTMTGYPSADKPWLKYYSEEAVRAVPPECTVYRSIYENNKDHPNDIALMFFGMKISYAKLFREIDRAASSFVSFGIKENDNVAICLPTVPETVYSILALNKLGANAALLNPMFTEDQLAERIGETEATLLITLNELYDRLKNALPRTDIKNVVCFPAVNALGTAVKLLKRTKPVKSTLSWENFRRQGKGTEATEAAYVPDRPALIVYSSGTTGASKGIQLTNASINATITDYGSGVYGFERQERFFTQIPVWLSTGIIVTLLVPLKYGVISILEPLYKLDTFVEHIEKYKPNFLMTPSLLVEYMKAVGMKSETLQNFKYLCVGGDYIAPARENSIDTWMKENGNEYGLHTGYGICECGATVSNTIPRYNVIGSAGIPLPHVTVSAFDLEAGSEL